MSARTNKEAYIYTKDSPVLEIWRTETDRIGWVFHFDLVYRHSEMIFYTFLHFKGRDNSFYRDMTGVPARHDCYYQNRDFDFEKELEKFIRKFKRYISNKDLQLTGEQYGAIRKFFRERRESDKA